MMRAMKYMGRSSGRQRNALLGQHPRPIINRYVVEAADVQ